MQINNNGLTYLSLNWPQTNINEFVQTTIGNGGSDIFIGEDTVFKYCSNSINEWQRLSFLNEKFLLSQLNGCIGNIIIPQIIEPNKNYQEGFMQSKVKGSSLYDIFQANEENGMNIINSDNFINSIAQFIVQFDLKLKEENIEPLKKGSLSLINQDNLNILKQLCPITYLVLQKLRVEDILSKEDKFCYSHNDLNLENIFIDNDSNISIIDFGEATKTSHRSALGKLFYSLSFNNNFDTAWNISQKVYELDKKSWVSPQEAIIAAVLPKINTLHFNLLKSDADIIQLTQNMENYTKNLLKQSQKYKFSNILNNFRNHQTNNKFMKLFSI